MSNDLVKRLNAESITTKVSMVTNVILYLLVSIVSMFHAYKFFLEASSPENKVLAILTTIAFEIGQVASLFSLNTLNKSNKGLIWFLFLFLTFVQVISNIGYGYLNISLTADVYFQSLAEFFSYEPLKDYLKHAFTFIYSGSLPIIALLFIKSLINYIAPATENSYLGSQQAKENKKEEDNFLFGQEEKKEIIIDPPKEEEKKIEKIPEEKTSDYITKEDFNKYTEYLKEQISDSIPEEKIEKKVEKIKIEPAVIEKIETVIKEPVKAIIEDELETIEVDDIEEDVEEEIIESVKPKKSDTVRVKVVTGQNEHTFKDVDKSKLTVF